MRTTFFRMLLKRLERRPSDLAARFELGVLARATARAFGADAPSLKGLTGAEALREYALFTRDHLDPERADPRRLYDTAYELGSRIRRITGFTKPAELERLTFYLYKNIEITMGGTLPGTITVPVCYFSGFYTPEQCGLMSRMDAGIIAGLFGGGDLIFSERITEGCPRCTAVFSERSHQNETE